jgi:hypothetical protein
VLTREEALRAYTHKGEGEGIGRRVFATLTADPGGQPDRTAHAVASLFQRLHEKGVISDRDVDDVLLQAACGADLDRSAPGS